MNRPICLLAFFGAVGNALAPAAEVAVAFLADDTVAGD